jgi:glycosyltransferase involved in cell wall biosynthesis
MRVLAFCDYYDPRSIGGAERVAHEIYTRLAADGDVQLTVVGALPADQSAGPAVSRDGTVRVVRVTGRDLSRVLGAQLMVAPGLGRAARREFQTLRPDVIHVNGLHFNSSVVGARLARKLHVPLVTTAHLADVAAMPGPVRLATQAFDRIVGGYVVRSSDALLAVSRSVSSHLLELGAAPARVVVAANGVDHNRFHDRGRAPRAPWLRVALVGRLISNKGSLLALEAVAAARAQGREVRLTVLGDGPLHAAVVRRAAQPDLAGAVDVRGSVRDVDSWLRAADVAMRPSFTEGLPLAVLEALACGTPVVCTDVPGNLEAVTHERNGLVVPVGSTTAMTAALVRLHDDRELLERMSAAAVEDCAPFTWEASAAIHLDALDRAAAAGYRKLAAA